MNENEQERLPDAPLPEDKSKQPSGQYLWRVLKPGGCILVLLLFIMYLIACFTFKGTMPEQGSSAPETAVAESTPARG